MTGAWMLMQGTLRSVALVLLVVLSGCGSGDVAPIAEPEGDDSATAEVQATSSSRTAGMELRPDLLRVEPSRARAGDEVELFFPQETERGYAYALQERIEDLWRGRYILAAAPSGAEGPPAWAPVSEPFVIPDDASGGPGPDRIQIPETATPGEYRVCTQNAPRRNFCAAVTVTD